jgi:hydroxypyruvate isomerase
MVKLIANLTTLFNELPPIERFAAARSAGFRAVEVLFPHEGDLAALAAAARNAEIRVILSNFAAGDRAAGDRGITSHPARVDEFREAVASAIEVARVLGSDQFHCMAGRRLGDISAEEQWATWIDNLRYAADEFARHGLTVLVEPLNVHDNPGYFLVGSAMGLRTVDAVGRPNLKLQYDIYHMQRGEGELAATIAAHLPQIGHIQIADNPGRHQPGTGEINYRFLLPYLDRIGYQGYVGLEYGPLGPSADSFGWIGEYELTL